MRLDLLRSDFVLFFIVFCVMQPKISVICLVYKVEQYIERCARSLFEQTLDEIEYIFIDDCSPDRSINILSKVLEEYPAREPSVRILHNDKNRGQAWSRRRGCLEATGEYVIHCDSDDWADKKMYEELYRHAKSNNFDLVWCDYYRASTSSLKLIHQNAPTDPIQKIGAHLSGSSSGIIASLCNHLYRRSLQNNQFIFPKDNMNEDFVMIVQLILNSQKIGYLPKPLYYYFENNDSICMNSNKAHVLSNLRGSINNTNIIIDIINNAGYSSVLKEQIVSKKYSCRDILIPFLNDINTRNIWKNVYPEINKHILFNNYISLRSRLRSFLIFAGLYHRC